jgi:hypothetical protein
VATSRATFVVLATLLLSASASGASAQNVTSSVSSCTSSITVLMNQYGNTRIQTGSTIWFSAVLEGVSSDTGALGTAPIQIDVRQSRITFGLWRYVISMPDSTITLDPRTREPQRRWVGNSAWSLTYAASQIPEAFFDGVPFTAPEPFIPAYSGPVTWTATFTASRPGITLNWAWSAAVYSRFGANGSLLVKPLTASVTGFQNSDPAGTPELFKQYVIPGAMGSGTPQYTGARSAAATASTCPSATMPANGVMQAEPRFGPVLVGVRAFAAPQFASQVSQHITLADGTLAQAVDRCYPTDLCALIQYPNGDQLAIYSEGATYCEPYVAYFARTNLNRTIYGFSRVLDHDRPPGSRCARTRATHILVDGGRVNLTVLKNADGTLRFSFAH